MAPITRPSIPSNVGTWTGVENLYGNEYRLDSTGVSSPCARVMTYSSTNGWRDVGWGWATGESYYAVRNNVLQATLIFPQTSVFDNNAGGGEFRLFTYGLPYPKDLGGWRICGTASHGSFGNMGSDFLLEWVSTDSQFKFILNHHGFIQILSESNKSSYIESFFGTYGGLSINLEYEI